MKASGTRVLSSILETRKLGVSSLESRHSSLESRHSSFESSLWSFELSRSSFESRRQRIYCSINFFFKCMYMSILLVYFWRQKVSSHDSRGGKGLNICKSVGLLKSIVFFPRLNFLPFDLELIIVHFRVTTEKQSDKNQITLTLEVRTFYARDSKSPASSNRLFVLTLGTEHVSFDSELSLIHSLIR